MFTLYSDARDGPKSCLILPEFDKISGIGTSQGNEGAGMY